MSEGPLCTAVCVSLLPYPLGLCSIATCNIQDYHSIHKIASSFVVPGMHKSLDIRDNKFHHKKRTLVEARKAVAGWVTIETEDDD